MVMRSAWIVALWLLLTVSGARAAQYESDTEPSVPLLGGAYDNPATGISFRIPAGCQSIETSDDSQIARYIDPDREWELKVAVWDSPVPLTLRSDPAHPPTTQPGLLDMTLQQSLQADPDAQILENRVETLNQLEMGILVFRSTANRQTQLVQIGLVRKSPRSFYIFNLTAQRSASEAATRPDFIPVRPTFDAMLRSIRLLDQEKIRQDQVGRLLRTRPLLALWTRQRVEKTLIAQQWQRIIRDGRDIGYSYIVEKPERRGNSDGINIGSRSRLMQHDGGHIDTESWLYSNIDRKHASWSTVVRVSDAKGNTTAYGTEIGADDEDFNSHRLVVTTLRKSGDAKPVKRDLPPWYLPQAFGALLPRLVPLDQPESYLFASYVSANQEVMSRYVEVLPAQPVEIHGRQVQAVTINDRFGINGGITSHYFTPEGQFLADRTLTELTDEHGVTRRSTLLILPSSEEELVKIWGKPDLSEPSLPNRAPNGR